MFQIVIAVEPRPIAWPTLFATGPETTSATTVIATRRTMTSVTSIWKGRSFQNGRPSSTS